jgi:hypothetical protein
MDRYEGDGLGSEARRKSRSAPPQSLEAGAVPAKQRFGLNDTQHVPQGRRDARERDPAIRSNRVKCGLATGRCSTASWLSEQGDLHEQRHRRTVRSRRRTGAEALVQAIAHEPDRALLDIGVLERMASASSEKCARRAWRRSR